MQAPSFDRTAYNCLNPDLSAVQYWLDLQKVLAKLDEAEAEKSTLLTSHRAQHEQLCRDALDRFSQEYAHQRHRRDRVPVIAERLIHCLQMPQAHAREIEDLFSEMLLLYAKFDEDAFKADWSDLFGTDGAADEIRKLNGRTGGLKKQLGELRRQLPKCFAGEVIPRRWQDIQVPESANKEMAETLGEVIINRFVLEWKIRSKMFAVPVTVYGTDINSLGSHRRELWGNAYKLLGMSPGDKPYYKAITSNERRMEKMQAKSAEMSLSVDG